MTETAFYAQQKDQGRLAQPFAADPWTGVQVTPYDMLEKPALESGGGGFVSTATDYSRFCQVLLNGGTLDGERIIGRKTLRFMASDHLGPGVKVMTSVIPPGYGFGLGFAVRLQTGMAPAAGSIGQFYWSGVLGTGFFIDPAENMFTVFMMQGPGQREYIRNMLRDLVYAAVD